MDVDIMENRASDQNDYSDFTCADTDEIDNGYSTVERKNKIGNKNQMVNLRKLLEQLCNSKVVLEKLPDSIISQKLQPYESSKLDIEKKNTNIVDTVTDVPIADPSEPKSMMKRYCFKCKVVEPNSKKIAPEELCTKCGTPLHYQCNHCHDVFTSYFNLSRHLKNSFRILEKDDKAKEELKTMVKRYCSSCKVVDPNVTVSAEKLCTKCGQLLHYQCNHCHVTFTLYHNLLRHLKKSCRVLKKDYDPKEDLITMVKRYCSNCKAVDPNVTVSSKNPCTKCGQLLHYQCVYCSIVHTMYSATCRHLRITCKSREGNFKDSIVRHKCSECTFETPFKHIFDRHFVRHHLDYSNADQLEEYRKACNTYLLQCKYCSYRTSKPKRLKRHTTEEHG